MSIQRVALADSACLLLFVPASRPERFTKATAAGADAVIIDLEDAVAVEQKDAARAELERALAAGPTSVPALVRVNAARTPWHEADLAAVARLPVAGVMLPKAERIEDLARAAEAVGSRARVIALIETVLGLASVRELAKVAGRLAFGSMDFAADVCAAHSRDALLHARSEIVLASRLAGVAGPIDGVTAAVDAPSQVEADAVYAASLGFFGKLLIHPAQVAPAKRGFRPTAADVAWAQRVIAELSHGPVGIVAGAMVDAPLRQRAEEILRREAKL